VTTTEQHLDRLWSEYLASAGENETDEISRSAFDEVVGPLVRCLNKIAGGGMFSETACIVAAREVLKLRD
jgi:hypothetical protein